MMKCEMTRDLLPLYIDNCCSKGSRIFVEEHLKECEECQKIYEEMHKELQFSGEADIEAREEEYFFKKGKEVIAEEVKRDYMYKAVWIDIVANVLLIAAGLSLSTTVLLEVFATAFLFIGAMAIWTIYEIIYIVGCHKGFEVNVFRAVSQLSISMKIIGAIVGLLGVIVINL